MSTKESSMAGSRWWARSLMRAVLKEAWRRLPEMPAIRTGAMGDMGEGSENNTVTYGIILAGRRERLASSEPVLAGPSAIPPRHVCWTAGPYGDSAGYQRRTTVMSQRAKRASAAQAIEPQRA